MSDIDKIKQLFATKDINNHKLGYILAKNTLLMTDEEIIRLIVEDWNGWEPEDNDYSMICYVKDIFNNYLDITVYTYTGHIDTYGLMRYSIKPHQDKDVLENIFYKELTTYFKQLINEIFKDDSTSSN